MKRRKQATATSIFISPKRFALVACIVAFMFCAVAGRLYYLHVVRSPASVAATDKARNRLDVINARRGEITDARGNIMATSRPVIDLGVDQIAFKNTPENVEKLAKIAPLLSMTPQELLAKCVPADGSAPRRWEKLADSLPEPVYERILEQKIKGIYGNRKYVRTYPLGRLASHAVGFVNREFAPVSGIERQFDFYMRGQNGWIETERDGKRREQPQFRDRVVNPVDGLNVQLTIDSIIQEMVQRQLAKIAREYSPEFATIIVSDPSTGYILAMGSYPDFDPNDYNKAAPDALRNRAISDQYEPGSTFKIVPVSAALNEGLVGPEDKFDCNAPTATFRGRELRLPKEAHSMGILSVRDIVKKSSNKGSARLGMMLGEKNLYEYARAFGYGEKTGLGLVGEIGGTLHKVSEWDGLTITRLPMGHAVAATPLQVHCAMSVIANQGIYMQPQLVKRVYDNAGETKIAYPPRGVRRVISAKIATLMGEMLSEVVSDTGTARRAKVGGFKVAGKTGTSQKLVNGAYSNRVHVGSFTGFFPAQRPRLVITVVVGSPHLKGVGYGGIVAAPAFREIAEQAAKYLGIQTDEEFEKKVAWKGF